MIFMPLLFMNDNVSNTNVCPIFSTETEKDSKGQINVQGTYIKTIPNDISEKPLYVSIINEHLKSKVTLLCFGHAALEIFLLSLMKM